ncbi:hypothetical protein GCM10009837_50380 [Streptomyces durmitorensis]|uniref:DUF8094 domain-containing protein n=1 Tax=Streptomyces durmitorensis TaxID=319947 RepID=A0ABY4Q7S5_9ACTN|nr:hypothetical protein [Streptomyces durmitorensis]UQT61760.1 hypothetical protein M4V62_29605 [Streptomyces durmitorensis]
MAASTATVLTVTATGCVTVHGEREVIPSATKAEADRALQDFLTAYNKAEKAYDPALDAARVTGPLGAINQAGLKSRGAQKPGGNPKQVPLELTDAKYSIPKKAGWPRWFVADTKSNRRGDLRWVLVFTKGSKDQLWEASYLNLVAPDKMPELKKDKDGWAEPVAVNSSALAVAPKNLGKEYTTYLKSGGDTFAPGDHTSTWKAFRDKNTKRRGIAVQYIDEPKNDGAFAPVGLRTQDGGAMVFFSTHHYEKQTAAKGVNLTVEPDVKPLLTGEVKQSVMLERVSNQVVVDPAGTGKVTFLSRIQGLTGAKGE